MDELSQKLGLLNGDLNAWYKVATRDVSSHGGRELLARYGNSLFGLLRGVYPDHRWRITQFSKVSKQFYQNSNDKRALVEEILSDLGVDLENFDSWYKVSPEHFASKGGKGLLNYYSQSLETTFSNLYPDHHWDAARFVIKPRQAPWKSREAQREFIVDVIKEIGIREDDFESFYNLTNMDAIRKGGSNYLAQYDYSFSKLIAAAFPEHPWDLTKFKRRPKGHWNSLENQREAVIAIGREIGIGDVEFEKWYNVNVRQFIKRGGGGLLFQYNNSLNALLETVFPGHNWDLSKFDGKPQSYWKSMENQRRFMDEIAIKLGFQEGDYEAWYKIGLSDLSRLGVGGLLFNYNTSLHSLLKAVYPEHKWDVWRFAKTPRGFLSDEKVWNEIMAYVEKTKSISNPEDWAKISSKELDEMGVKYFIDRNGGLANVLQKHYPQHDWINLL